MRRLSSSAHCPDAVRTLAVLLAGLGIGGAAFAQQGADESKYEINIPAGTLQASVDRLAVLTHLQLLYDPSLLERRSAPAVTGRMSVSRALAALLATSDIEFQFTAPNAVALFRHASARVQSAAITKTARPPEAMNDRIVTVSADRQSQDMRSKYDLSATKTQGSPLTAPVSFQSVDSEELHDQQASRLQDALMNVSSVEPAPDGQSALGFALRGFPTYQYYLDGVRVSPDLHHDGYRDLANVERIDVVKGPASTLYGRMEPGGLINVVTKQPLAREYSAVDQSVGAFGFERTQLDLGGPLNADTSVQYRLNAVHESGGSFRELQANHRLFVAPVVKWIYAPTGELSGYAEYLRSSDPTDSGLPIIGSRLPPVPAGRRVEDGGDIRTTDLRVGVRGDQSLGSAWTIRYHLEARWLDSPQSPQLALADDGLSADACSLSQCAIDQQHYSAPVSKGHTYYASSDLIGSLPLGSTMHSLLAGVEHFDVGDYEMLLYSASSFSTDLFQPRHQPVPTVWQSNPDFAFAARSAERWTGVYLQDQVHLGRGWSLTVGARYDHVSELLATAYGFPLVSTGSDSRQDNALKSRAALLFEPVQHWVIYANYTENFGISTGLYGNGQGGTGTLLPAESAHELEIGLKTSVADGGLSGTAALYDLTEVNIPQLAQDPLLNSQGFYTVTGAVRSRGLELDLQGGLAGLQWKGSYAYTDSRIIRGGSGDGILPADVNSASSTTGNRLYGVARHGGSLWIVYSLPAPGWSGLKLGAGVIARTARNGDNANDYQLPGYATWNLLAAYRWQASGVHFNVQLNIDNALDSRSFESVSGSHEVMPNTPRRWLLGLRADF